MMSTVHNQGLNDTGGGRQCFTYANGLEGIANNVDDDDDGDDDGDGDVCDQIPNSKRLW